jgi:hypothetical protein
VNAIIIIVVRTTLTATLRLKESIMGLVVQLLVGVSVLVTLGVQLVR